jgi:hypothetical protein
LIDGFAERFVAIPGECCPGDRQITSRVTNSCAAEVDDGCEFPVRDQQVARGDVAVEPDGHSAPLGGQGNAALRSTTPASSELCSTDSADRSVTWYSPTLRPPS